MGILLVVFNQASVYLSSVVALKTFDREQPSNWVADISSLPPGDYFVSAGKPTGLCDLQIGTTVVVRGHTEFRQTRDALLLGSAFSLYGNVDDPQLIRIRCTKTPGVSLKFPEPPVIATRNIGIVLHGWRFILHVLLGPGSSLLLLTLLFVGHAGRVRPVGQENLPKRVIFAAMALAYSLSLAYVTRLFLSIEVAYTTHAIMRCAFAFMVLTISGTDGWRQRFNLALLGVSAISLAVVSIVSFPHVVKLYKILYILWSMVVVAQAIDVWRRPAVVMGDREYRVILAVAAIFHGTDFLSMYIEQINVQTPILIMLLCILVGMHAKKEASRNNQLYASAYKILRTIQGNQPLYDKFVVAAHEVQQHNPLLRISAYVDAFCFGRCSEPRRYLERVLSFGYRKDTSRDAVVNLAEDRGKVMLTALTTNAVKFGVGRDGGHYAILPVGAHACINLSDDVAREPAFGSEAQSVLEVLEPAIRSLEAEFRLTAERSRLPINGLLAKRGVGTFPEVVGSLFLDVVGYSKQTRLQKDAFGSFVKGVYFTAIERALDNLLVREFSRGDELYLCAINGFPGNWPAADAVAEALRRLVEFVESEGDRICSEHGFPKIRLSVGAAAGMAELVVTESDVTTMGDIVNQAKRLQDASGSGEILVNGEVAEALSRVGARIGVPTPRLVKGCTIVAHSVVFPKTGKQGRSA